MRRENMLDNPSHRSHVAWGCHFQILKPLVLEGSMPRRHHLYVKCIVSDRYLHIQTSSPWHEKHLVSKEMALLTEYPPTYLCR